jgi:hypothetical protein
LPDEPKKGPRLAPGPALRFDVDRIPPQFDPTFFTFVFVLVVVRPCFTLVLVSV